MRSGFPWHEWGTPHTDIASADHWWKSVEGTIANAIVSASSTGRAEAEGLARAVRLRFTDPSIAWRLHPEAPEALPRARRTGWRNVILSNHVPELPSIVAGLGIADEFERVYTSALIGYEKPHVDAFRIVLADYPNAGALMIGDSRDADYAGAINAGIGAILVGEEVGVGPSAAVRRLESSGL